MPIVANQYELVVGIDTHAANHAPSVVSTTTGAVEVSVTGTAAPPTTRERPGTISGKIRRGELQQRELNAYHGGNPIPTKFSYDKLLGQPAGR